MEENVRRERIRGIPQPGELRTVSAALLAAGPVIDQLLAGVIEDYRARGSLFLCLLAVAGGILLLTARNRKAALAAGGVLTLLSAAVLTNQLAMLVSLAAWAISFRGVSWNKIPGAVPDRLRMPVLNLAAAVLAAVSGLLCLREIHSLPIRLLPTVISAAGAVLLCGNVEAETFLPRQREQQNGQRIRYRSVPGAGGLRALGAVLILACGVWRIINLIGLMSSFDVPVLNLLWPVLTAAAGVFLLLRDQRERWLLPAAAVLAVCQVRELLSLRQMVLYSDQMSTVFQQTQRAALLFGCELLVLISAVGVTWNAPVGKRQVPVLNVIAAALAAVGGIWEAFYQISAAAGHMDGANIRNLLLALLLYIGLVLLNLSMEVRELAARERKVDGEKYRHGLSGFVHGFYSDVGGKLQLLAKICGLIYLILGVVGAFVMALSVVLLLLQLFGLIPPYFSPVSVLLSGLITVVSALILAVGTWPLYAFGQMAADVHAIRKSGVDHAGAGEAAVLQAGASADGENPDELPEL